ncbi:hypothetical protein KZ820_14205 [Sphingomonas sp. RRHST34]|uniref:Uncharacterized protein n=1 Tax=Sphingomonas citri TaxID=2862499 RepID=A0ABS7BQN2_9SPHN|nr:hypothetical protein [Sphingomonas citri]MBW6531891.1 hypothetical protein [Sphingomonas citri]
MTTAAKAAYPRRSMIERAIAAAKASGIKVGGFEVDPDGTIRILSERNSAGGEDAYARWKAKERAQG